MASIKLRNKGRKNDDSLPPSYNLKNHHFEHMQPRFCIDFCFFVILIHNFTIYNWCFDSIQNFYFCSFWTPIFAPSPAPCLIHRCKSKISVDSVRPLEIDSVGSLSTRKRDFPKLFFLSGGLEGAYDLYFLILGIFSFSFYIPPNSNLEAKIPALKPISQPLKS